MKFLKTIVFTTIYFGCFIILGQSDIKILRAADNGKGLLCKSQNKRVLFIEGTPEEMGSAHGELLKKEVHFIIEKTLYVIGAAYTYKKNDWFFTRIDEAMRRELPYTPKRFIIESDALALAAGINKTEFCRSNFFPEMFHCSGVAVRNKASKNGQVVHARVLDYMMDIGLQKIALVIVCMPEGRNAWINAGYAGFIGTVTAMNEKGLAIGEMGGRRDREWNGCPMTFLLRDIMERADNVEEALTIMRETPRTCEYYYVLSDKDKNIAAVHVTPEKVVVLNPGEQHRKLPPVPEDTVYVSSRKRAKILGERLKKNFGKIDVNVMKQIIKRPVAMRSNLQDAVFTPETLDIWIADAIKKRPACDCPYAKFNLPEMINFYKTHLKKVKNTK